MTTLSDVTVKGLAGREGDLRIHFRPDVNIFFGLNGSGKDISP
jgi:hypothetical protein